MVWTEKKKKTQQFKSLESYVLKEGNAHCRRTYLFHPLCTRRSVWAVGPLPPPKGMFSGFPDTTILLN